MKNKNIIKLTLSSMFIALGVVGSFISFPLFGSKCAPVQHMVNILCAVFVGPWYGVAVAFITSLIRNLTALGTPLAYPGSMCGVLLAGILYRIFKKLPFAYIGELVGTGVIGGMLACPVAILIIGKTDAALFTFVVPFLISSLVGTIIAIVITVTLARTGLLKKFQAMLEE